MTSLKAVKSAVKQPSKAEIVLLDSDILRIAPVVAMASDLLSFEKAYEKQAFTISEKRQAMSHEFITLMIDIDATYQQAQAYKKHIITSLTSAQKVTTEHAQKSFNKALKEGLQLGDYGTPKFLVSDNKSAKSNSKARAEFETLSDSDIKQKVQALAKAEDFAGASKYSKELERRAKVKALEIKRSESKAVTSIKADIKKYVTTADMNQLVAFVYTMNNIDAVLKLANQSK